MNVYVVESFGLDLGSYSLLLNDNCWICQETNNYSYNDKEVCVWCQNFVGLNLTSFLPHTPGRKSLPIAIGCPMTLPGVW
jgi:hypothetical protein